MAAICLGLDELKMTQRMIISDYIVNPSGAGSLHIRDPHMIIAVAEDVQAHHGHRLSLSTVLTAKLSIFSLEFLRNSVTSNHIT